MRAFAKGRGLVAAGRRRATGLARLADDLARLGDGRAASLKIRLVVLLMPLKSRIRPLRDRTVGLRLRDGERPLTCLIRQRCDLWVLHEVFGLEAYEVPGVRDPRVILDLGSNIGVSVLYFHARYPDARIYALEPDQRAFELLQANTRELANVSAHPIAVAARDGEVPFFPAEESFASSMRDDQSTVGTAVTARKLDTLLRELSLDRVDLLKVDIEGAEHAVFAASQELSRVGTIVGELHVDLIAGSCRDFVALLEGFDVRTEREHIPSMPAAERYSLLARNRDVPAAGAC